MLRCANDPAPPGGEGVEITDRDVAAYLIELWEAGADCRAALAAVREIQMAPLAPAKP
ncbi:MAG: hypothetical protein KBC46_03545 [Ferrovibrio sp.]|nr:hypothetical protein [Ferrovibrio sp.]